MQRKKGFVFVKQKDKYRVTCPLGILPKESTRNEQQRSMEYTLNLMSKTALMDQSLIDSCTYLTDPVTFRLQRLGSASSARTTVNGSTNDFNLFDLANDKIIVNPESTLAVRLKLADPELRITARVIYKPTNDNAIEIYTGKLMKIEGQQRFQITMIPDEKIDGSTNDQRLVLKDLLPYTDESVGMCLMLQPEYTAQIMVRGILDNKLVTRVLNVFFGEVTGDVAVEDETLRELFSTEHTACRVIPPLPKEAFFTIISQIDINNEILNRQLENMYMSRLLVPYKTLQEGKLLTKQLPLSVTFQDQTFQASMIFYTAVLKWKQICRSAGAAQQLYKLPSLPLISLNFTTVNGYLQEELRRGKSSLGTIAVPLDIPSSFDLLPVNLRSIQLQPGAQPDFRVGDSTFTDIPVIDGGNLSPILDYDYYFTRSELEETPPTWMNLLFRPGTKEINEKFYHGTGMVMLPYLINRLILEDEKTFANHALQHLRETLPEKGSDLYWTRVNRIRNVLAQIYQILPPWQMVTLSPVKFSRNTFDNARSKVDEYRNYQIADYFVFLSLSRFDLYAGMLIPTTFFGKNTQKQIIHNLPTDATTRNFLNAVAEITVPEIAQETEAPRPGFGFSPAELGEFEANRVRLSLPTGKSVPIVTYKED